MPFGNNGHYPYGNQTADLNRRDCDIAGFFVAVVVMFMNQTADLNRRDCDGLTTCNPDT